VAVSVSSARVPIFASSARLISEATSISRPADDRPALRL
jgi:hypothetical protein